MFADIVGFTKWSSMREPSQVFKLLENIYEAFDELAEKKKVFKVRSAQPVFRRNGSDTGRLTMSVFNSTLLSGILI